MKVPKFREAVIISDNGVVYVFPLNAPNVAFVWDAEESRGDWGNWFAVTDEGAFKVVLHVGDRPYGTVGGVNEYWDDVLRKPQPFQVPPTMFFILVYAASRPYMFSEPLILSIKDFDRGTVRWLARSLLDLWLGMAVADSYDDYFDYEDFDVGGEEEEGEEEECYWCIDREQGICYYCED